MNKVTISLEDSKGIEIIATHAIKDASAKIEITAYHDVDSSPRDELLRICHEIVSAIEGGS